LASCTGGKSSAAIDCSVNLLFSTFRDQLCSRWTLAKQPPGPLVAQNVNMSLRATVVVVTTVTVHLDGGAKSGSRSLVVSFLC
jgi:hypothetical protein